MFKIISDSACDLSDSYVREHDLDIIPVFVSYDAENYLPIDQVDRDEFYQKLVDDPTLFPKTSLPSVELYANAFRKYAEQNIPVICFTISIKLSGSFNSARNAKMIVEEEFPNAQIIVLDSMQNTVTQALIIDQVVRMRSAGLSIRDVLPKLDALMKSARIIFTVGSLDYLKINGRIGKVAQIGAGKLGVKPIIIMKDGEIGLGGIGRNRKKLRQSIIDITQKYISTLGKENYIISVGYGYDKEEGFEFMKDVEEQLDVTLNTDTNVAIGITSCVHTGPYAIGIGVIQKYETL
ncbi:MAG: DegV family protein [Eubacterium sp.]|nr:DegV family protein [Eubacterium sp.]